ncbi:MAG: hypothetical protein CSA15_12775, partial [Candidatus Delongbacteria bacterium]
DQNIVVDNILPSNGGSLSINEGESLLFSIDAHDPDGNSLIYSWKLDGNEVSTDSSFNYVSDYSSAGVYTITLNVTDGSKLRNSISYSWTLTVNNVNRAPTIVSKSPEENSIIVEDDFNISFSVFVNDEDNDPLSYSWFVNGEDQGIDYSSFYTNFTVGEYIVKLVVTDGIDSDSTLWNVTSAVDIDENLPKVTKLYQNYPNPFNPSTTIKFDLFKNGYVNISIYDIQGALVRDLLSGYRNSGTIEVYWNGLDNSGKQVSAGEYLYRMSTSNGYNEVKRMIMIK